MRGARSDACQQIAKGFYNMLGSMLGRNPHSNTPTPDLRIHLRIAEQKPAVEQAAMAARHRQATRNFFKVADDFANSPAGTIVSTVGSLATLPANFSPLGIPTTIAQTYQGLRRLRPIPRAAGPPRQSRRQNADLRSGHV